jgi:peptidoglycan/LPS O-acetylase OafA/YrhL
MGVRNCSIYHSLDTDSLRSALARDRTSAVRRPPESRGRLSDMASISNLRRDTPTLPLTKNCAAVESATVPQSKTSSYYRPELDCLRFFAFFAVFVHHSMPTSRQFYVAHHLPTALSNVSYAGAFGVDLFFCLSAYLITELLLREKEQIGYLNVKSFYIRRILRIWPLYFAFVLFAFGLTFVDRTQHFSASQLTMFLMLAGNWAAAVTVISSVVAPLWSVSIEEQFYLLWPLAVRKATRKQMLIICLGMITLAFAWRAFVQIHMFSHDFAWNATFAHLDSIGYGILLSLVGLRKEILPWARIGLLLPGLAFWYFAGGMHGRDDVAMALSSLGSMAILQAAIGIKLDYPVLVRLGVVSYGLYTYHALFLNWFNRILSSTHGWGFVLWWILSLSCTTITAFASYRWLETPFLKLKNRFTIVKSRSV